MKDDTQKPTKASKDALLGELESIKDLLDKYQLDEATANNIPVLDDIVEETSPAEDNEEPLNLDNLFDEDDDIVFDDNTGLGDDEDDEVVLEGDVLLESDRLFKDTSLLDKESPLASNHSPSMEFENFEDIANLDDLGNLADLGDIDELDDIDQLSEFENIQSTKTAKSSETSDELEDLEGLDELDELDININIPDFTLSTAIQERDLDEAIPLENRDYESPIVTSTDRTMEKSSTGFPEIEIDELIQEIVDEVMPNLEVQLRRRLASYAPEAIKELAQRHSSQS